MLVCVIGGIVILLIVICFLPLGVLLPPDYWISLDLLR